MTITHSTLTVDTTGAAATDDKVIAIMLPTASIPEETNHQTATDLRHEQPPLATGSVTCAGKLAASQHDTLRRSARNHTNDTRHTSNTTTSMTTTQSFLPTSKAWILKKTIVLIPSMTN